MGTLVLDIRKRMGNKRKVNASHDSKSSTSTDAIGVKNAKRVKVE